MRLAQVRGWGEWDAYLVRGLTACEARLMSLQYRVDRCCGQALETSRGSCGLLLPVATRACPRREAAPRSHLLSRCTLILYQTSARTQHRAILPHRTSDVF